MGGKGSGRPRGSEKPLSEVFADIQRDIEDLHEAVYKRINALHAKLSYHVKKHKVKEYRRKIKELGK
jgi:hypothetical protein